MISIMAKFFVPQKMLVSGMKGKSINHGMVLHFRTNVDLKLMWTSSNCCLKKMHFNKCGCAKIPNC